MFKEKDGVITSAHGSGGLQTFELINAFRKWGLENRLLSQMEDSTVLPGEGLVVTTDSYTVYPLFFPGGDIGKLAACGTINDLAVRGARPLYFTLSLIIEEGFLIKDLEKIIRSFVDVCSSEGILVVAGDTKVIPKKVEDEDSFIFVSVTGIGSMEGRDPYGVRNIKGEEVIIVSRDIGRHGACIALAREDIETEDKIESDCASLYGVISDLYPISGIRCIRDCTRGGLATVLCEWAQSSKCGIQINEEDIPISQEVRSVCEIFGFDPLYMACEGTFVLAVCEDKTSLILERLRRHPLTSDAAIIGRFTKEHPSKVVLNTAIGGSRIVDMLVGDMLPRIC